MLSVVICAYNEEANLPRAVSSAKSIADEIVVVDTASTDKTAAVARRLGCKVYRHKYPGIVEPVRNFAVSKAGGDWIFLLDADEEISKSLADLIKNRIAGGTADYYRIPRKNIIFGKWIKSEHWWPDYVYRLFRKGSITWDDRIHSLPITSGRGGDFPPEENAALIHHNYGSISQFISRLNRYTDFQADDLDRGGYSYAWQDVLIEPIREFMSQFFARKAYRDGVHGLALSLLQSFSQLVVYLKLWEKRGFMDKSVEIGELPAVLSRETADIRWWYYTTLAQTSRFPKNLWWKLMSKISRL